MTPSKLAKKAIESVYGKKIILKELTIGKPLNGWTADFWGRYDGQRHLMKAIFDGDDELSYFDPKTVDFSEQRTDDATPIKRILKWNGFEIGLQYLPFEKRHGRILPAGYGHFRKTRGADGMAVDVYVGTQLDSPKIFVIDQFIDGEFDEEKMVIGVERIEDAIAIYTSAMPREMMGGVREISLEDLAGYRTNIETKADAVDTFQPAPVGISDYADLSNLIEFNWDAVRDVTAEQGWTWDAEQGRYLASDEPVPYERILEAIQAELGRLEDEIEEATSLLTDGEATVTEWEELVAETVVAAALLFFLLGLGRHPTSAEEERLAKELGRQFKYLRNFSRDILSGTMTAAGIAARAKLYIHDAELGYVLGQEMAHSVAEWPYYSNVLGGCEHCPGCPDETRKGIVPRGELVPIGQRLCRWRCCCQYAYHKEPAERNDDFTMLDQGFGWL